MRQRKLWLSMILASGAAIAALSLRVEAAPAAQTAAQTMVQPAKKSAGIAAYFAEIEAEIASAETETINSEDAYLLAKIAMAEAEGEDTEGKALVIRTVLNRMENEDFPDSVSGVIYEKNAFTPVSNGRFDCVEPDADCWVAVEMVENGWDGSEGALYFERTTTKATWHSRNLQKLFIHGNHSFYTEGVDA